MELAVRVIFVIAIPLLFGTFMVLASRRER